MSRQFLSHYAVLAAVVLAAFLFVLRVTYVAGAASSKRRRCRARRATLSATRGG